VAQQTATLSDYDAAIAQSQADKQTFSNMVTTVLAEPAVGGA
jgi:hypothetical protein